MDDKSNIDHKNNHTNNSTSGVNVIICASLDADVQQINILNMLAKGNNWNVVDYFESDDALDDSKLSALIKSQNCHLLLFYNMFAFNKIIKNANFITDNKSSICLAKEKLIYQADDALLIQSLVVLYKEFNLNKNNEDISPDTHINANNFVKKHVLRLVLALLKSNLIDESVYLRNIKKQMILCGIDDKCINISHVLIKNINKTIGDNKYELISELLNTTGISYCVNITPKESSTWSTEAVKYLLEKKYKNFYDYTESEESEKEYMYTNNKILLGDWNSTETE